MLTAPTDVFPRAPFEAGVVPQTMLAPSERGRSSSSESAAMLDDAVTTNIVPVEKSRRILDLLADAGGAADVRAVCINLDRRPDRWEQFFRNCPIAGVERFAAIDGRKCRPPEWWRQGGGAWGCMLSHIGILQRALMDGLDQRGGVLLVLEDDALFPPDFAAKAERFLLVLPKDWDQLYFGGQHRGVRARPPQRINSEVIRPYMVNRTQAYAVRGEFMRVLYRHLCNWPDHARHPRHHVDHRMELLHACGRHNVYAPTRWIIGQAGGKSDVSGRMAQDRYWNYHLPDRPERDTPDTPRPAATGDGDG
ncbi:MAG: glycosyltransferase family 25 protein, partial [Phycisphaerae bacterium]|nr:glycosyltransferase family 25 protein [Phycisphaerae bacterium]